jgi:hypothetical protein
MNRNEITFTDENGWTANIEVTKNAKLTREIVKMCETLDDVQRCAAMGDFRIKGYDLPSA